jgi:hypothetical protein
MGAREVEVIPAEQVMRKPRSGSEHSPGTRAAGDRAPGRDPRAAPLHWFLPLYARAAPSVQARCAAAQAHSEALSYNGLVQSWPEIMRLTREGGESRAEQGGLFGDTEVRSDP